MADVKNQATDLRKSIQDMIAKAKEALANNDIDTAKQLQAEIEDTRNSLEEIESLNDQLEEYESELGEASGDEGTKKDKEEPEPLDETEDGKEGQQSDKSPDVETQDEDSSKDKTEDPVVKSAEDEDKKDKKQKEGAKRSMAKLGTNIETNEKVEAFDTFMKSRGAKRDNIISDDVGVTIPEEIKYKPEKEVKTVQDLSELVDKTSVNSASGKHPVLKRANAKFNTVAELEENPKLAKPEFLTVSWDVQTYRGAIPISQESIDDSVANVVKIVQENIKEQKINTLNDRISGVLKTFTPQSISNVDGLKEIVNVKLDPAYTKEIVCTQSFYQSLDTLKDKNGRYLLQDSIINTSGTTVLGMPVTVVRDDLLGASGDKLAFIGDVSRGVFFADRSDISVDWVKHDIYGKYLMGAFRFDVKQLDPNAGFFVTLTDEVVSQPTEEAAA